MFLGVRLSTQGDQILHLRYSRDAYKPNGFRLTRELTVRWTHLF